MNFGYEGKKDNEIIKNFNKNGDEIIVNFIDGHATHVLLNIEEEVQLLNKMLEQAKERNISSTSEDLLNKRKRYLIGVIFDWFWFLSCILKYSVYENEKKYIFGIIYAILSGAFGLLGIVSSCEFLEHNEKLNELKKYAIYLDLIDRLEINQNSNDILKIEDKDVNINNLDNYSLKEIRRLRDNLKRNINYRDCFAKENNYPEFIKKLSK